MKIANWIPVSTRVWNEAQSDAHMLGIHAPNALGYRDDCPDCVASK